MNTRYSAWLGLELCTSDLIYQAEGKGISRGCIAGLHGPNSLKIGEAWRDVLATCTLRIRLVAQGGQGDSSEIALPYKHI